MSSYIGCKISSGFKELLSFLAFLLVSQSSLIHFLFSCVPNRIANYISAHSFHKVIEGLRFAKPTLF